HTSGLPDYFEDKPGGGVILLDELRSGIDRSWTFEEAVAHSKRMTPFFKPGEKGKAHYSDTNFQLLGKIIEGIDGKQLAEVLDERIFRSLALKKTYLFTDCTDTLPADIYYKDHPLHIPKAMASFGPDGGIVSTAEETMTFLKAFFNGRFFPQAVLKDLYHWNSVMFPLEYGVGVMRFKLPWIFSPFKPMPELIGHSGLSGAFAYFCPEKDVFMTGTVNQIHSPGTAYKLMLKLITAL
ncbi:MAG: beta-lactamase family protein, partial [Chlorobiales bacterium]|nr:beta-lactamase family protein [Chlorobiales bacterium]